MKRDNDGHVTFEENEEGVLIQLYRANGQALRGGVSLSAIQERSGLDPATINQIAEELIYNYIIANNRKAGTFHLTPYGRLCAVYVINKPKQEEKQARFLRELYTNSPREKLIANEYAVDRYVIGRSVGCNQVEVDNICVELSAKSLIEYEFKEITIFQGTDFERTREIPTKKIRITPAGIETVRKHNQEAREPVSSLLKAQKPEAPPEKLMAVGKEGLPQEKTASTANTTTNVAVDEISGIIKTIVLGALAIGLLIVILFYK